MALHFGKKGTDRSKDRKVLLRSSCTTLSRTLLMLYAMSARQLNTYGNWRETDLPNMADDPSAPSQIGQLLSYFLGNVWLCIVLKENDLTTAGDVELLDSDGPVADNIAQCL
ncbi:hypothetical protein KIN20_001110 [Parelaphostrongylus tenuis]|uniref:Uncharacterized protein n=1 Tax=Parelaphostrongylus tenuis TaxID=148309 RepID=A0AAD5QG17_PARTN|nr:hypothetical protein KIN20_001110 [Parelaphostrongylus tenuis]